MRKILFALVLVSLLVIPYSLIAYSCYLGLCGGSAAVEIGKKYNSFYLNFSWIYLIIATLGLIFSWRFSKYNYTRAAKISLIIPLLCLLPFLYVEINSLYIQDKYDQVGRNYNLAKAEDYVCTPGVFIRVQGTEGYYFFDYDEEGETGSMTAYPNYNVLKKALEQKSIQISNCKNKKGQTL